MRHGFSAIWTRVRPFVCDTPPGEKPSPNNLILLCVLEIKKDGWVPKMTTCRASKNGRVFPDCIVSPLVTSRLTISETQLCAGALHRTWLELCTCAVSENNTIPAPDTVCLGELNLHRRARLTGNQVPKMSKADPPCVVDADG
eukprot:1898432-Rhodomonas_salina.1